MESLKMNLQLSKSIYEAVQDYVELRECYNNIFNVFSALRFSKKFNIAKDYRVGYGYINKKVGNNFMFFRHGFLIENKTNSIIDVTACLWKEVEEKYSDYEYYTFKEYNLDEYIDALMKYDGMPALYEDTQEEEIALYNKLIERGNECNPIDQMELLNRIYGANIMQGIKEFNDGKSVLRRYKNKELCKTL